MITPANAGPTARATLTPTISSRVAAPSWDLGTSSGIVACQVGSCNAAPTAKAKINASKCRGHQSRGGEHGQQEPVKKEVGLNRE